MILSGTRFGDIEFLDEDIVHLPEGLIGFPGSKRYLILSVKPNSPFRWLQSIDEPALAFLCTDPAHYVPYYAPTLSERHARDLQMNADTPRMVLCTAAIPKGKPEDMTLNLAGPIVVNAEARVARQIVLEDGAYTVKHRVFPQTDSVNQPVAA
jgi:flagellar assembly factor FliW